MSDNKTTNQKTTKSLQSQPAAEKVQSAPAQPVDEPKPSYDKAKDAELLGEILSSVNPEAELSSPDGSTRQTVKEMVMAYFKPTDLVKIRNPFRFDTGWAYSHPDDTKIEQDGAVTRRVWLGRPRTRLLHAGEEKIIPGWEAYIGIDRFYKQYCQTQHREELSVAMNSPYFFKKFMDSVYLGVFDPNGGDESTLDSEETARISLEHDLGLR